MEAPLSGFLFSFIKYFGSREVSGFGDHNRIRIIPFDEIAKVGGIAFAPFFKLIIGSLGKNPIVIGIPEVHVVDLLPK